MTTIITIITIMDYSTKSYTQETPAWLWKAWTHGPADDYDRYDQRLTRLIAADVLEHCPDELGDDQQRHATDLATEVDFADVE
jgi:hypothetical protein